MHVLKGLAELSRAVSELVNGGVSPDDAERVSAALRKVNRDCIRIVVKVLELARASEELLLDVRRSLAVDEETAAMRLLEDLDDGKSLEDLIAGLPEEEARDLVRAVARLLDRGSVDLEVKYVNGEPKIFLRRGEASGVRRKT